MSGLMLTQTQSDVPYFIKEIGKNVYSIEELSYYLYNHLYLVDEDFFGDDLIEYIGEEGQLVGAVSVGYADEKPCERPRHDISDVMVWR